LRRRRRRRKSTQEQRELKIIEPEAIVLIKLI